MATWQRDSAGPIQGAKRALVRNVETGETGFVAVQWTWGGPMFYGAVSKPHLDADGQENGDSTTLDGDPQFV